MQPVTLGELCGLLGVVDPFCAESRLVIDDWVKEQDRVNPSLFAALSFHGLIFRKVSYGLGEE